MTPFQRWRIAVPLAVISALLLGATALGAWAYWNVDSTAENALTVFLCLMFVLCLGTSLSIGFDRKISDVPWLRIGTVLVFIVLSCGVSWVRDTL
ncbi:hypothetical protein [Couchioplanes azureus]|uniref:hypothetical protein n=1 Tax=Couchioplanes caeruleus TaxID=56438 RepID=UPI00167123F3|nr:hypothetical protein [Couchioplanes caeruleus]GGQ87388.1 hypothetical protein GCM10010166_67020 [Couchioplanes caeruleus subsp. azureus]